MKNAMEIDRDLLWWCRTLVDLLNKTCLTKQKFAYRRQKWAYKCIDRPLMAQVPCAFPLSQGLGSPFICAFLTDLGAAQRAIVTADGDILAGPGMHTGRPKPCSVLSLSSKLLALSDPDLMNDRVEAASA